MQRIAPLLQQIEGGEANVEMLSHGRLIERVGRTGQFDLAVQRFIGDAEQRAVGDAKPEALRRDGAALHVDGDGAGEVDATALLGEAQLPISVIVGDDGAGAKALFQGLTRLAGDTLGGVLQRDLDFGQGGDRHFRRHEGIENAILAQIAVANT